MTRCKGIASDGSQCDLEAGYGTDDDHLCIYHDDQFTERCGDWWYIGADWKDDHDPPYYERVHVMQGDTRLDVSPEVVRS